MDNTKKLRKSSRLMEKQMKPVCVKHDPSNHIYYIDVENGKRAFLEYDHKDNCTELIHTEVPADLQGRGLGKLLAKEALEHVAQHKYELVIKCDFIEYFVNKYEPQYLKYIKVKSNN